MNEKRLRGLLSELCGEHCSFVCTYVYDPRGNKK